ncbi:unnamed protein product [Owenia fusiformis]|uniref:Uncharacterized protein n=1 Tax=Owenia fusiformis TaxID=6347 RepID=A0A8J1Y2V7_OWEFU|nr:unnamed protein product [Owenia fusiformis]
MSENKTVMIPVDASHHAEQAFDWYAEFIHKPTFTVHVFHCHEPLVSHHSFLPGREGVPRHEFEEDKKKIDDLTKKYEEKLASKNITGKVSHKIKQHPGHTIWVLVRYVVPFSAVSRILFSTTRTFLSWLYPRNIIRKFKNIEDS